MLVLGIIAIIVGVVLAIIGNEQNNDLGAQFESFLSSGSTNPGDTFLYIGIAVAVVGLILLIVGITQKNKK